MTQSPFLLSRADAEDALALSDIGRETFTEKFGHLYTPENLEAFLSEFHSPEWYAHALSERDVAIWVIRNGDGPLAGYGVAGPNTLPVEDPGSLDGEVKRIYVRGGHQGQGLGSRLHRAMLAWLEGRGHDPLYVGVYSDNDGAQKLYRRFGFEKCGEYTFLVGAHEDHEFIFRREGRAGPKIVTELTNESAAASLDVIRAAFGQEDEADLVSRLRADDDMLFEAVAIEGGQVAGHVALSRLPLETLNGEIMAASLAPVSVRPDAQSKGLGMILCEAALSWWQGQGAGVTVVLGHPAYYPRFGFSAAAARAHLQSPFAEVGDAFMLSDPNGQLTGISGAKLHYAPAFGI
ncbi:GNAT family N-acetyltransferase [Parvularcula marina]|uniref:GNAT family N-acetyltransferase n=1 Tax=Parvularcula marina TaxID=2292771 RepID=A0A371RH85_9PROT|nr:GNAT family N-acetyltransferase [Parvularcula marina]RFB04810.1 GNAT family N-acetyltransferase [Parvularcula marina]